MTNKELISKDSVLNLILKYGYLLKDDDDVFLIGNEIKALPTFSPEAIIEEMIEEIKNHPEFNGKNGLDARGATAICYLKMAGEEFLSRIRAENIS